MELNNNDIKLKIINNINQLHEKKKKKKFL